MIYYLIKQIILNITKDFKFKIIIKQLTKLINYYYKNFTKSLITDFVEIFITSILFILYIVTFLFMFICNLCFDLYRLIKNRLFNLILYFKLENTVKQIIKWFYYFYIKSIKPFNPFYVKIIKPFFRCLEILLVNVIFIPYEFMLCFSMLFDFLFTCILRKLGVDESSILGIKEYLYKKKKQLFDFLMIKILEIEWNLDQKEQQLFDFLDLHKKIFLFKSKEKYIFLKNQILNFLKKYI